MCSNDGHTQWFYRTREDTASDVLRQGYFEQDRSMFRDGDLLTVNAHGSGATEFVQVVEDRGAALEHFARRHDLNGSIPQLKVLDSINVRKD
jgi:hypothetical protein